ncbi:hypothetical protein MRX96_013295 [Rhipicephalus microplus]
MRDNHNFRERPFATGCCPTGGRRRTGQPSRHERFLGPPYLCFQVLVLRGIHRSVIYSMVLYAWREGVSRGGKKLKRNRRVSMGACALGSHLVLAEVAHRRASSSGQSSHSIFEALP